MQLANRNRSPRGVAALAVVCGLLQLALVPNLGVLSGRINLALVFSAYVALTHDQVRAVLVGFLAGLFFDLSSTGPLGLMALCLSCVGYVLASPGRSGLAPGFGRALGSFAVLSLVVSLAYHLAMMLVGQADSLLDVALFRALPTALLTTACFVPLAWRLSQGAGLRSGLRRGRRLGRRFSTKGL